MSEERQFSDDVAKVLVGLVKSIDADPEYLGFVICWMLYQNKDIVPQVLGDMYNCPRSYGLNNLTYTLPPTGEKS